MKQTNNSVAYSDKDEFIRLPSSNEIDEKALMVIPYFDTIVEELMVIRS
ncbi:hypothetical protein [Chitinophaga sp.]